MDDNFIELDNAILRAFEISSKFHYLRLGQCIFNECYSIDFLQNYIDNNIRGTDKDCFFIDANIDKLSNILLLAAIFTSLMPLLETVIVKVNEIITALTAG